MSNDGTRSVRSSRLSISACPAVSLAKPPEVCLVTHFAIQATQLLPTHGCVNWLPSGKRAAVCFSVDDVHPSTSADAYEAGGDLSGGALGHIERLLDRHALLKVTLFVTPDWRPMQLVSSRRIASLPLLGERVFHIDLHSKGRFRLDRHPGFVRFLNDLPRTDVAPHGLHHVHRGPNLAVEFQNQSFECCIQKIRKSLSIFSAAGLDHVMGFSPPGWNLPPALQQALDDLEFRFVVSARDIRTTIAPAAKASMSGLRGAPLVLPQTIGRRGLVHFPVNFQATSDIARAEQIIACNGVLSIKAHVFKHGGGHTLLDGLDDDYVKFLDALFSTLEQRHGDALWWASMNEIAARYSSAANREDAPAESSLC